MSSGSRQVVGALRMTRRLRQRRGFCCKHEAHCSADGLGRSEAEPLPLYVVWWSGKEEELNVEGLYTVTVEPRSEG